jgi:hypothetical protein
LGLKLRSSERAKIALVKKVGVKLAFLVVYNGSEIGGRDKGRMRMADTDADEKTRMGKCGWGIKRGWENADGG